MSGWGFLRIYSKMAQGSSWLRRACSCWAQSRQRQNTRGMKAPIATKIGSMDELRRDYDLEFCTIDFNNRPYLSSSVYGSATRGPLGFLRAEVDSWEQELAQDELGCRFVNWSKRQYQVVLQQSEHLKITCFVKFRPWDRPQLHPPPAQQGVEPAWGSLPMSPEWWTIWQLNGRQYENWMVDNLTIE